MKDSSIEWTHHTFNVVEGCTKVSEECDNCYAWARDRRYHPLQKGVAARNGKHWGRKAERLVHGTAYWNQPRRWDRLARDAGERHRIFCSSLADVFDAHPTVAAERAKLWPLIEETLSIDWLLLTKRPENVCAAAPWAGDWPSNVWLGTTCGMQHWADKRLPILASIPAAIRFVSVEPMLEPMDLTPYLPDLDWVIVGGESGPGARPFDPGWAAAIVEQCARVGVACFVKQLGDVITLNGDLRRKVYGPKGKHFDKWPATLRVRQFPTAGRIIAGAQPRGAR